MLKGCKRRANAFWQTFTGNMLTSLSMWNTYTVYNLSSLLRNYLPLIGEKFDTPNKNVLDFFIPTSLINIRPPRCDARQVMRVIIMMTWNLIMLYVNIIMLHVDMIMLHVEMVNLVCLSKLMFDQIWWRKHQAK